jgi:PAS domain S-box-containing protein
MVKDDGQQEAQSAGLRALERNVFIGFAVAAIVLVVIAVFSLVNLVRFRTDARSVAHTHQVLNSLSELSSGLTEAESSERGFLVTGKDQYQRSFDGAVQKIQQQQADLQQLTSDNAIQQMNLKALAPLLIERLGLMRSRLETAHEHGLLAAQAAMSAEPGARVRESILELVGNMQYEENHLLEERQTQAESSGRLTREAIASGGILALGLLVAAFLLIRRSIERNRRSEEELVLAKNSLEERVRERTSELVRSGAAVRAGEERLSRIIDSAMDAIITVDEQRRITMFNPAAEKMFRCPVSDALGTPLERFLPARFRTSHAEHMRSFGENSVTRRTMGGFSPLSALRTNGEEFPIEASISQVQINGSKFFTAIVRDVSETAKAREVAGRLAAIVESTDDAIISKTLDGIITSWNPAAERLFGYSSGEVLGKPMLLLVPPELKQEERDILARIVKGDRIEHFETRRLCKQGRPIDVAVTISPLRDSSGRVIGASTIARDITDTKRIQEETAQQAALLSLAPAVVRDMSDRIVLWTRGAQQLYGHSQEQALGRISHELLATVFPQPLADIQKTVHAHGIWEGELEHRARDGKRVVVASQWVLHRDPKGRPSRILEANADITALKQAEALQQRSQKLESLGTLAGGIAHDFNNILSAINGSALLAISQLPADHPAQICLTEIEKAGARAADLVRRILTFSRPQDQNMQVQEIQPVIEDALKLVRSTLPAMIEIRTEFAHDLPKVRIDATQIYQVVVNLATNAAHAIGDKNGVIEVKLEERTVNEQEVLLYSEVPAGHYLRLQVSDNGCGMDSATLQRIFDPFFSTKPTGKGTGLGLSVVHGIITAHRGLIKVYSEPGKGTTFHTYLPAVQGASAIEHAAEGEPPMGNGERILFVDDEGVLLFVGTMTLEQSGYKVTGMPNGESALHELRQNPHGYDVVVTDLSMPGMSGLQLAHQLRKIRPDLPVVLTSGYANPDDQEKANRLGIRAILTKPVNTKDLLSTLAAIFVQNGRSERDQIV